MARQNSFASSNPPATELVTQNTTARYLKRARLQRLLEQLFPGHTQFSIEASAPMQCPATSPWSNKKLTGIGLQMKDDQWCFSAPRKVSDDDIDNVRDE
ncbi:uncharacterized protein B0I36DRAFT_366133 [Microdochium trichocladiopsis]|uniref:Uncharacterized protein n=1 Tax=Microdochium trichocladiopsis TaxID=1682393 RepID=A0A9P9BKF9_9PEZI|nr:uncharacterized protein B0I36DRAFT_366133 [Microdochium trichocladiopsis]KAH7026589.1 hypothetical protein B0I36DRAFT_366133 [Microdochium trichocladiopsis]